MWRWQSSVLTARVVLHATLDLGGHYANQSCFDAAVPVGTTYTKPAREWLHGMDLSAATEAKKMEV
jgi:hypothetical protein